MLVGAIPRETACSGVASWHQAGGTRRALHAGAALPAGLCDLLADLAGSPSAAVSAEALAALQLVAAAQPDALHSCWDGVRAVLLKILSFAGTTGDVSRAAMLSLPHTSSNSVRAYYSSGAGSAIQSSHTLRSPVPCQACIS